MIRNFTDIVNLFEHDSQACDVDLSQHRGGHRPYISSCSKLSGMTGLFEHRGEPDPQKVKEREEAHQRGLERHKNVLQRQQLAEKARKERQQDIKNTQKQNLQKASKERQQDIQNTKKQNSIDKQQTQTMSIEERQQKSNKVKQALQNTRQQKQEQQKQELNKKQQQVKQTSLVVKQQFNNAISKAPTDSTKDSCKELDKKIQEINQKAQKQKKTPKQVEKEYNEVVDELENNLKSDEEKSWFRKMSNSNLVKCSAAAFTAWWELFGYKDITDDIASVSKKYTGLSAYHKKDKEEKIRNKIKKKHQKKDKENQQKDDSIDKSIKTKMRKNRLKIIDSLIKNKKLSRAEAQRTYTNAYQNGIMLDY